MKYDILKKGYGKEFRAIITNPVVSLATQILRLLLQPRNFKKIIKSY